LDDDIAGAEEAERLAEGKMHVKRNRRSRGVGFGVDFFKVSGAEGVVPDRCGGIGGVARPGAIVAGEEILGDAKLVADGGESWGRSGHERDPWATAGGASRAPTADSFC